MAVTGVISASETVYHIALDPMSISKGAGGAAAVLGDNVDVINVTMTTANNAKAHMQELIQKITKILIHCIKILKILMLNFNF